MYFGVVRIIIINYYKLYLTLIIIYNLKHLEYLVDLLATASSISCLHDLQLDAFTLHMDYRNRHRYTYMTISGVH